MRYFVLKVKNISSSVDWEEDNDNDEDLRFNFDSDNDSDDATLQRRTQNFGMLSIDEFLEYSRTNESNTNDQKQDDFFEMISNQFDEHGRSNNNEEVKNTNITNSDKLILNNKTDKKVEIVEQENESKKIEKELKVYEELKEQNNMLKFVNVPKSEGKKFRIIAKKIS